ncbi:MAG TPA: SDR family NAD(P)-dependent oxidoreductase [Blastocatellia bacterium]|nr:SDR family NAD(P)-dependent oxidoreductase [Blastocatellia bacterium]
MVNDINASEAEETARLITAAGGEAAVNVEPVGAMATAQGIVKLATDRFGRLDILVNNAGNQAVNPSRVVNDLRLLKRPGRVRPKPRRK